MTGGSPPPGVAWITGASSGIGAALAWRLAADGWTVVATARDEVALADVSAGAPGPGSVRAFSGDVTAPAAMERLVGRIEAELGPIALAVLNAGVYLPVDGANLDRALFERSIAVNLNGTINTLIPLVAAMRPRRAGRIAVVSSVAGYRGLPTSAAYGATKAGLINLVESLRFDLDPLGIRLQLVTPGFVDTPATRANPFPMPHLVSVDAAADRIAAGLAGNAFEITFPRRFTFQLKVLRMLPYALYFPLIARATGWSKRG